MPNLLLTPALTAFLAQDPILVINFSGGKDSTVMLDTICRQYPYHEKHAIFADTGWEHPDAEEWSRDIVGEYDLDLNVVRNPNKTYLSMVEAKGRFPSAQYRQCTSDLKRGVIQTWIRRNLTGDIMQCLGIRAEESPGRAKMEPVKLDGDLSKNGRTVWMWYPVFEWKIDDVFAHIKQNALPLHRVYSYLSRFSCRVCIFNTGRDLSAIRKHDPEAFEIIASLEKRIKFTMNPKGSVIELADTWDTRQPGQHEPARCHETREQLCLF